MARWNSISELAWRIGLFVVLALACVVSLPRAGLAQESIGAAQDQAGAAQDSTGQDGEQSLGAVARNLRREKAQEQASAPAPPALRTVVDNDNLSQVMEDARKLKPVAPDKTVLSLDASGNKLTVSSPDVTCSMSFTARASSLIVKPVLVEDLPAEEVVKLDGPASIHDDNLQLDVFNGTEWALREITVGLTLERRPGEDAETAALAQVLPAVAGDAVPLVERRSDVTLLFHLKTETKPFDRATLREFVGVTPGPDEDWRWSIVSAKGIRPEGSRVAPESLTEPLIGGRVPTVPLTNAPAMGPPATNVRGPNAAGANASDAKAPGR
ncbi:MAG: hypothetical protein WB536_10405 [Terriglobales bacterium]